MRLLKNLLVNYSIVWLVIPCRSLPLLAEISSRTHFMRHVLKNPSVNYSNYRVLTCVSVTACVLVVTIRSKST